MKHLINQTGTNAEIMLYGIIGKWMDIDVDLLVKELENLKKSAIKNLTFYVNSDGGEVMQGQALYNYLNRNEFQVTWVIDGIAASMMAMLITNPKHTVIANKYSKLMYHRLDGMVRGNADEVRNYADMMDTFESDLIDMFASRTKLESKKVKKDFFNNTDRWVSAQEALELGLVNEIKDGNAAIVEPGNLGNCREVYDHFTQQLLNLNNKTKTEIEMKKIALLLNLAENATEDVIATAIQNILDKNKLSASDLSKKDNEITDLKKQIAEANKAKVKNIIDNAITNKKFGEDMRQVYTDMANDNFERAEKVINSLTGVAPVIGDLGKSTLPEAEKNWTFKDYVKNNKAETLKATNLERFKQLYKEEYKRDYKE